MRQRQRAQAGFSLVELLVAVVILAVGLLGLAELQITAMKTNAKSEGVMAAAAIAQGVIEQVAAMDEAAPLFDSDQLSYQPWPEGATVTTVGGAVYNVSYTVDFNYQNITNLCLVTVRVQQANARSGLFGVRPVEITTLKRST